jgi:hypothetical protein
MMAAARIQAQNEVAKQANGLRQQQYGIAVSQHNAPNGERGSSAGSAALSSAQGGRRRGDGSVSSRPPTGEVFGMDSSRQLWAHLKSARAKDDKELVAALRTIKLKAELSMSRQSMLSQQQQQQQQPEATRDSHRSASVDLAAAGGESWREYATERGKTARISRRIDEILEKPVNNAKINNQMFFGKAKFPMSEYQDKLTGGVRMNKFNLLSDKDADVDTARWRLLCPCDFPPVHCRSAIDPPLAR